MVDYQAAIEALLDQAVGSADSVARPRTVVAGWADAAIQAVGRMLGIAPTVVASYADDNPRFATTVQSGLDSYVASQLPDGMTVDDWVAIYITGLSRPNRANPMARTTREGRVVPTPPLAFLVEAAEEDEGLSIPAPPPVDSRPRNGGTPVDYLPAPPSHDPYTPQLAGPDLTSPAMRDSIGRWAGYFFQHPELWASIVQAVLRRKSTAGRAPNAECMRALADELPGEMRKALTQFQCGFPAPVGLKRTGKDAFMMLKISASGVDLVPNDPISKCGGCS